MGTFEDMYTDWLMTHKGDEIGTKDQLIDAQCNGYYREDFVSYLHMHHSYVQQLKAQLLSDAEIDKIMEDMEK